MILTFSQVGNLFYFPSPLWTFSDITVSSSQKFSSSSQKFSFLSKAGFWLVFNLTPWNYLCQGHPHFFFLFSNSAAFDLVAHPLGLKYFQLLISATMGCPTSQILPSQLLCRLHLPCLIPQVLPGAPAGRPFLPGLRSVPMWFHWGRWDQFNATHMLYSLWQHKYHPDANGIYSSTFDLLPELPAQHLHWSSTRHLNLKMPKDHPQDHLLFLQPDSFHVIAPLSRQLFKVNI